MGKILKFLMLSSEAIKNLTWLELQHLPAYGRQSVTKIKYLYPSSKFPLLKFRAVCYTQTTHNYNILLMLLLVDVMK